GASTNTITQSSIFSAGGNAAQLDASANYNIVSQSTMTSRGYAAALKMQSSDWNTMTQDYFFNAVSPPVYLTDANGNTSNLSTIAAPSTYGLYLAGSSINTLSQCFI